MSSIAIPNRPAGSAPRAIADILANFDAITTFLNGANLDQDNLAASLLQKMGVSSSTTVRRGKSIIAATDSRTNVAYGLMPTPDQVQNIVLPTDGLIFVAYQATWQGTSLVNPRAAIFIGANQVKVLDQGGGGVAVQEAIFNGVVNSDSLLYTSPQLGLQSANNSGYPGDVTTGQMVGTVDSSAATHEHGGGPLVIFAAAGTYDVSVQFKASSGSVTAKNRKLWVWTLGF